MVKKQETETFPTDNGDGDGPEGGQPAQKDIKIRLIKEDEFERIAEIRHAAILNIKEPSYSQETIQAWADRTTHHDLRANSVNSHIWVLVLDGSIEGYIELSKEMNEVWGIFIHPNYWRQGLATKMFEFVESIVIHFEGKIRLRAGITSSMFYEKLGFQKVKKILYREMELYIMEKSL